MVLLRSTRRVVNQFDTLPIMTVVRVSTMGKGQENQIRQILKRPNIADGTARAYGRLARQYLKILSNPSKTQIKHVKKLTSKTLTNNVRQNANVLGNINVQYKQKLGTVLNNYWKYLETVIPNSPKISLQKYELLNYTEFMLEITKNQFTEYRVILKLSTSDGIEYISTSILPIYDIQSLEEFFELIDIVTDDSAIYADTNRIIYSIEKELLCLK